MNNFSIDIIHRKPIHEVPENFLFLNSYPNILSDRYFHIHCRLREINHLFYCLDCFGSQKWGPFFWRDSVNSTTSRHHREVSAGLTPAPAPFS